MLIQNTNPANVAPEQRLVHKGFMRDDLFTVVHEQFMTDTAKMADLVLPATMFLEHDDIYRGGGQQHVLLGAKLIEAAGEARENLYVLNELANRLGVGHMAGFNLSARQLVDNLLTKSNMPDFETMRQQRWLDKQPDFETSHYLNGFAWPDGKFRFRVDWQKQTSPDRPPQAMGLQGPFADMPEFPDYWEVNEQADPQHPFKLTTSPAHNFLNSSFSETPTSLAKEVRPQLLIRDDDAAELGLDDGARVEIGNERGALVLHVKIQLAGGAKKLRRGVVVSEGLFPNSSFEGGEGINILTGADAAAPHGGTAFHDIKVWIRPCEDQTAQAA
jgi:anaerobic selenocysteine-containing dehydrogenase